MHQQHKHINKLIVIGKYLNRTLVKIKLTPPVQTISIDQPTQGWFKQTSFLVGVEA